MHSCPKKEAIKTKDSPISTEIISDFKINLVKADVDQLCVGTDLDKIIKKYEEKEMSYIRTYIRKQNEYKKTIKDLKKQINSIQKDQKEDQCEMHWLSKQLQQEKKLRSSIQKELDQRGLVKSNSAATFKHNELMYTQNSLKKQVASLQALILQLTQTNSDLKTKLAKTKTSNQIQQNKVIYSTSLNKFYGQLPSNFVETLNTDIFQKQKDELNQSFKSFVLESTKKLDLLKKEELDLLKREEIFQKSETQYQNHHKKVMIKKSMSFGNLDKLDIQVQMKSPRFQDNSIKEHDSDVQDFYESYEQDYDIGCQNFAIKRSQQTN